MDEQTEFANEDIYLIIDYLVETLESINTGATEATKYHKTVTGILELIFYPYLVSPIVENEIHDGRKRIDTNAEHQIKYYAAAHYFQ